MCETYILPEVFGGPMHGFIMLWYVLVLLSVSLSGERSFDVNQDIVDYWYFVVYVERFIWVTSWVGLPTM